GHGGDTGNPLPDGGASAAARAIFASRRGPPAVHALQDLHRATGGIGDGAAMVSAEDTDA
ncbi:MAG: hypothetical protein ACKOPI_01545, partial [bacterium]